MNEAPNKPRHAIIGVWSHNMLYAPGAAADEILVFRPDCTGVCEIYNWTLCSYDTFTWRIENDGTLTIQGQDSFESDTVRSSSSLRISFVPFQIAPEGTPVHGTIDVLHVRLAEWLPGRLGRTKADIATYVLPKFD